MLIGIIKKFEDIYYEITEGGEGKLTRDKVRLLDAIKTIINFANDICFLFLKFSNNKKIKKTIFMSNILLKFLVIGERFYHIIKRTNNIDLIEEERTEFEIYVEEVVEEFNLTVDTFDSEAFIQLDYVKSELPKCLKRSKMFEISFDGRMKPINYDEFSTKPKKKYRFENGYGTEYYIEGYIDVDVGTLEEPRILKNQKILVKIDQDDDVCIFTKDSLIAHMFVSRMNNIIINKLNEFLISLDASRYSSVGKYILNKISEVGHNYNYELHHELVTAVTNSMSNKIKTGILIYGPPGVGKSATIDRLLFDLKDAIKIKINLEKLAEAGSAQYINVLNSLNCKKVLFIDDIDIQETAKKNKFVVELLSLIDSGCYDVVIGIMNNNDIHETIKRSGRFDVKIPCDFPNVEQRVSILQNVFGEDSTYDLFGVAQELNEFTHADIVNIKNTMLRFGMDDIHEAIEKVKEYKSV